MNLPNCVQATPGCACLFLGAQVRGAPDAHCWANQREDAAAWLSHKQMRTL